jgi:hypothetical protein
MTAGMAEVQGEAGKGAFADIDELWTILNRRRFRSYRGRTDGQPARVASVPGTTNRSLEKNAKEDNGS